MKKPLKSMRGIIGKHSRSQYAVRLEFHRLNLSIEAVQLNLARKALGCTPLSLLSLHTWFLVLEA